MEQLSMEEKIEACFERLQTLDIAPSLSNMEKLVQTLYELREVYQYLKGGEQVGGSAADSDGRNNP